MGHDPRIVVDGRVLSLRIAHAHINPTSELWWRHRGVPNRRPDHRQQGLRKYRDSSPRRGTAQALPSPNAEGRGPLPESLFLLYCDGCSPVGCVLPVTAFEPGDGAPRSEVSGVVGSGTNGFALRIGIRFRVADVVRGQSARWRCNQSVPVGKDERSAGEVAGLASQIFDMRWGRRGRWAGWQGPFWQGDASRFRLRCRRSNSAPRRQRGPRPLVSVHWEPRGVAQMVSMSRFRARAYIKASNRRGCAAELGMIPAIAIGLSTPIRSPRVEVGRQVYLRANNMGIERATVWPYRESCYRRNRNPSDFGGFQIDLRSYRESSQRRRGRASPEIAAIPGVWTGGDGGI